MRAAFNDAAAFEHDDFVAIAYRAQAVGDDDAAAASAPQVVVDGFFGDRIKCSRRFIQDKDRGIANQSSGDFDALTLTAAEVRAAFIDVAVIISRSASRDPDESARPWPPSSGGAHRLLNPRASDCLARFPRT